MRWRSIALLLHVVVVLFSDSVGGEVVHLDTLPAPAARSFSAVYVFYAADGNSTWRFEGRSKLGSGDNGADVQVVIIPYAALGKLLRSKKFCANREDVTNGLAKRSGEFVVQSPAADVFVHAVTSAPTHAKMSVHQAGVYVLGLANCGTKGSMPLMGTVTVKQSYGFLPGNEYPKANLYGAMFLLYTTLGVAWLATLYRQWSNVMCIHGYVAFALFLADVDALLWLCFYKDLNRTGELREFLFVACLSMSVLKLMYAAYTLLSTSLGKGVTCENVEADVETKMILALCALVVVDFGGSQALAYKYSRAVTRGAMFVSLTPLAVVACALFCWMFNSLARSATLLEEKQLIDQAFAYKRLRIMIFLAAWIATILWFLQVFDTVASPVASWRYQWLISDGMPQVLFVVVLVAFMCIVRPSLNFAGDMYVAPEALEDEESELYDSRIVVSPRQDAEDVREASAVVNGGGAAPSPDTIGAGDEDEGVVLL